MRAIFTKILLLLLLTLPVAPVVANNCNLDLPLSQQKNVTRVKVDNVIDGDTLRLQNNELVRFIGINTPEIDHEAGNSQPLAEAARDFLQTLIDQQQGSILIQYDKELEDRLARLEKNMELFRVCLLQTKPVVEEFYKKRSLEVEMGYA